MIPAQDALKRLQEGNIRFVEETDGRGKRSGKIRRHELMAGQEPFAIILGCSDSRVSGDIIFDQGLGDLFGIRVVGNIVMPSQLGSIEFAAERYRVRLVVVLGHSMCGAVQATVEALKRPTEQRSLNIQAIVDCLQSAVEGVVKGGNASSSQDLVEKAVRANVRASVEKLRNESEILEKLIRNEKLHIIGAEYSLETGIVDFFDTGKLN